MSVSFLGGQRASLIEGLIPLYRPAELVQAGTPVSDGRGGFTASTTNTEILVQLETLSDILAAHNITPSEALIFVLNDGSATPHEGDAISVDSATYMITRTTLDPVGAVYECVCAKG